MSFKTTIDDPHFDKNWKLFQVSYLLLSKVTYSYVCEILVLISPSTLWVILFKRGANCYFHLSFKGGPYGLQVTCCHVVHTGFSFVLCVLYLGTKALYYNNCLLLCKLLEKVDEILTKKMFCATPLYYSVMKIALS